MGNFSKINIFMQELTPYLFLTMGISGGFILIFWLSLKFKKKQKSEQ